MSSSEFDIHAFHGLFPLFSRVLAALLEVHDLGGDAAVGQARAARQRASRVARFAGSWGKVTGRGGGGGAGSREGESWPRFCVLGEPRAASSMEASRWGKRCR